jgi:hypothetical protein
MGSNGKQLVFIGLNFNASARTLCPELPGKRWGKLLESSDASWDGPGTTAPEILVSDHEITLQPESFVLYEMRPSDGSHGFQDV